MKMLLYCTKAKPYIKKFIDGKYKELASFYNLQDLKDCVLFNGKIVAECDFEVEEIFTQERGDYNLSSPDYFTKTLSPDELADKSCLTYEDIDEYLDFENGYAIHIKNLHIFDEPKELSDYCMFDENGALIPITKAPQNMMYAVEHLGEPMYVENHYIGLDDYFEDYVLISIRPEWLCKILNGEKTIEVRKKVLKEMLK